MRLEAQVDGQTVPVEPGWTVILFRDTAEVAFFPKRSDRKALIRIQEDAHFAPRVCIGDVGLDGFIRGYTGLTLGRHISDDEEVGYVRYIIDPAEYVPPMQPRFLDPHDSLEEYTNNGGGD